MSRFRCQRATTSGRSFVWRSLQDFVRSARTSSRWYFNDVVSFSECAALSAGRLLCISFAHSEEGVAERHYPIVASRVKFYSSGAAHLEILKKLPQTSSFHSAPSSRAPRRVQKTALATVFTCRWTHPRALVLHAARQPPARHAGHAIGVSHELDITCSLITFRQTTVEVLHEQSLFDGSRPRESGTFGQDGSRLVRRLWVCWASSSS